jgi:drug/metabolite transporter (DMT)-like permease
MWTGNLPQGFAVRDSLRGPTAAFSPRLAGTWAAVGYLTVFSTAFAYGVWQRGIARIGPNEVLVYLYLITMTGVISSVVVLHEGFGPRRVIGAIVLLASVYL